VLNRTFRPTCHAQACQAMAYFNRLDYQLT
jgi:hypothetical protein